ncbi:MAG: hypothetical protein ACREHE_04720 [Rhizomicrobium sp.]
MTRTAALCAAPFLLLLMAADAPDPLAPARDGSLQCYDPRPLHKTCHALDGYTFDADGTIHNEATVLISPDEMIVMKTVSPVVVRDGAVCGPVRRADVMSAAIYMQGRKLPQEMAVQVRLKIAAAMTQRFDKEVCTTYAPYQDELYAHVTLDGQPDPESSDYVRWVKPDDGYTVAP